MIRRLPPVHLCVALFFLLPGPVLAQSGAGPAGAQPSGKTARPKAVQIAFFTLEAQGVEAKVTAIVSDTILINLSRLPDATIIGSKEIDAMLGFEQKKQLSGCTDTSCMVAIGGALGVDKIVTGSVGKLGESHVLNLKLLSIRDAKIEQMYQKRIKGGTEEAFLDLVPEALAALFPAHAAAFEPAPTRGAATIPSPREPAITKEVAAAGPGVYPWILAGAGAAMVVAGGVVHSLAKSDYDAWKKLPESDPGVKSLKDSGTSKQTTAFVLYGVGGAAAVGGLVWYFVSDNGRSIAAPVVLTIAPLIGTSGVVVNGSW
ncbi:MAG: hypothetical protein HY897_20370 [Deltaproteobacteria bacterium]|nr:hypothetical protein [Deltaproteobacteria bacterium]